MGISILGREESNSIPLKKNFLLVNETYIYIYIYIYMYSKVILKNIYSKVSVLLRDSNSKNILNDF
jgi:hypothetical protein